MRLKKGIKFFLDNFRGGFVMAGRRTLVYCIQLGVLNLGIKKLTATNALR